MQDVAIWAEHRLNLKETENIGKTSIFCKRSEKFAEYIEIMNVSIIIGSAGKVLKTFTERSEEFKIREWLETTK